MEFQVFASSETSNNGEKKVLDKLKKLYENKEGYLYSNIRIKKYKEEKEPDFILIDPLNGIAVIEVKSWSLSYIATINQHTVTTSEQQTLPNPIIQANTYFNLLKDILPNANSHQLSSRLFFPNMPQDDEIQEYFQQVPSKVFYKDDISNLTITSLFMGRSNPMSTKDVNTIRARLYPETKIQKKLPFFDNKTSIDEDIKTISKDQERIMNLPFNGYYLLSGVPGSGKTIVIVGRAIKYLRFNPEWSVIVITYTNALVNTIKKALADKKQELEQQNINIDRIRVSTFHSFAYARTKNISDDYYENGIPEDIMQRVSPRYDAICIDEYQDFHSDWIKFCIKAIKPKDNNKGKEVVNLFLAGDKLQSIYARPEISWKHETGLNISGRSHFLKISYRASHNLLKMGLQVLESNSSLKKEVLKFYEDRDTIEGHYESKDDSLFAFTYKDVADCIGKLLSSGFLPGDILVIANQWWQAEKFHKEILHIDSHLAQNKQLDNNKVNIITYHSAKGIENKIAVLLDVDLIDDRKILYVGITRASQKVILHANDFKQGFASDIYEFVKNKISLIPNVQRP